MTSGTPNLNTLLCLDPSSTWTGWASLAEDGRVLERGRWTPGGCFRQELHEILARVRPRLILLVLPAGGTERTGDILKAVELLRICEERADGIEVVGGLRAQVVALAATRGDVGDVVEAARWWLRGQDGGTRGPRPPAAATIDARAILAIDPSSTRAGWAALDDDERIIEAGHLTPGDDCTTAAERIAAMVKDLEELLDQVRPGTILIEWPSGHPGARHKGKGAGLAIYGAAVGALWRTCEAWADGIEAAGGERPCVELIREDVWTRRQRKRARALALAAVHPEYRITDDRGMDAGDAIEMAQWYIRERRAGSAVLAQVREEEGVT